MIFFLSFLYRSLFRCSFPSNFDIQVNATTMIHCGFYSENGGFRISEEDKAYMKTCKVVVSTCAFGGGDDLYQPIGMSKASLENVWRSMSKVLN